MTWYENDGSNAFTRRTIDNSANGAKRAEAADIDRDLDVAAASFLDDTVAWHENSATSPSEGTASIPV